MWEIPAQSGSSLPTCHATGLKGGLKDALGVNSAGSYHYHARGDWGAHPSVVRIVWGARMELECPCVIRRTALSRCLSPRFKCPVMKSTEPPAPGFSLSLFSTWPASPSSRQQISSPNHLKPKRLVCGSCFIPLRSACCRHVCQLQHVASGSSHMQHAATGIRAT